jgi:hypothetical protein
MLNPELFKYMNCQFGDKVDENYMYAGIYNNILLINQKMIYLPNYALLEINIREVPTFNELNYIFNVAYNNALSLINLTIKGIKIHEFLNVDNFYYAPNKFRYIMYIKRIPLK